jgi:hypothetical protein
MGRIRRFIFGQPGWSDYLFQIPPKQPDARAVYLAGTGLITAIRGAQTVWGQPPQAWLFVELGSVFVLFWGWVWIAVGVITLLVAATGHRHPDWDRLSAFSMLMLWFVWGLIYLVSAWLAPTSDRRLIDLYAGLGLIFTGIILSAGVIQGLRKTHEIYLREQSEKARRDLEVTLIEVTKENERLRLDCEHLRRPEVEL